MQPSADIQQDNERVSAQILEKLGQTLRVSFEATTEEQIPRDMALLLLRIAFAQALERVVEEDAREFHQARILEERVFAFASPQRAP
jgi:hypothetical protein